MRNLSIHINSFRKAESIIKDLIFEQEFDSSNEIHIRALKLLKARKENLDFEIELALRICGDNNNYPYRSSKYLTRFFQDLGFDYEHKGETRRFWVEDALKELSILDLVTIIEKGLFRKRDYKNLNFRPVDKNKMESDDFLQTAIKDFRKFIDESTSYNSGINLTEILDLNINIELLFENNAKTRDKELNMLIEESKSRFLNPKDKQIALEKIWDAFERIKTYYGNGKQKKESADKLILVISNDFDNEFINDEFNKLTALGNRYRIRHHETNKLEIKNPNHVTYLFFRMLSLMDLCLKYLNADANNFDNQTKL